MVFSRQGLAAGLFQVTAAVVLTSGLSITTAGAQTATVSDAQIEANVLKALAGAPQLANENIVTRTVYGTVTLTGVVPDEASRRLAETLAANASGVQKVMDELTLGERTASSGAAGNTINPAPSSTAAAPLVLQSDGSYAPMTSADPAPGSAPATMAQRNDPDADQALDQQQEAQSGLGANSTAPASQAQTVQGAGQFPVQPGGQYPGQPYPQQPNPYGASAGQYPNQATGDPYPQAGGYGGYGAPQQSTDGYPVMHRRNPYPQNPYAPNPYGYQAQGGQAAGQPVIIPASSRLQVRVNRTLSSQQSQPGTPFDGTVLNDVVAGGLVAIPRGASVQGTVVDARASGTLKGRGELSIQLTQVTLGGRVYPLQSDVWARHGGDKTIETLDKTAGFGAVGAGLGALGGGGIGAAVGGGIGAALGLGSSATSGRGQVFVPAEGVVSFQLAAPATVQTVSAQEMQRLAYGVPQGGERQFQRPRSRVYVGPVIGYPGYYPYGGYPAPYGYPPY